MVNIMIIITCVIIWIFNISFRSVDLENDEDEDFLSAQVSHNTTTQKKRKYSLSILNSKSEETHTFYFDVDQDWGIDTYIPVKELMKNIDELLFNGKLRFVLKVITSNCDWFVDSKN